MLWPSLQANGDQLVLILLIKFSVKIHHPVLCLGSVEIGNSLGNQIPIEECLAMAKAVIDQIDGFPVGMLMGSLLDFQRNL